jgi:Uma2 family endonuclease
MGKTLSKPFRVGTTGWTAADLDDPRIEAKWEWGRYVIINGVLTKMAPGYLGSGISLANLMIEMGQRVPRTEGSFAPGVDIIIDRLRVVRCDLCFMTPTDRKMQDIEARRHGKPDGDRARLYVPPGVVVEALCPGHRAHDRVTKFGWYAEFGVKNFWMLDAFRRTLEEFVLSRGGKYKQVSKLRGDEGVFAPAAFPGVKVPLTDIWPAADE